MRAARYAAETRWNLREGREREKKREIVTYVSHRANLVHNM